MKKYIFEDILLFFIKYKSMLAHRNRIIRSIFTIFTHPFIHTISWYWVKFLPIKLNFLRFSFRNYRMKVTFHLFITFVSCDFFLAWRESDRFIQDYLLFLFLFWDHWQSVLNSSQRRWFIKNCFTFLYTFCNLLRSFFS